MSGQLSFDGFEPPPESRPGDPLFFAIYPDTVTAAHIAQHAQRLRNAHGLSAPTLRISHFHITLHVVGFYDSVPQDVITAAGAAAASIAIPPFGVTLDRVMSFGGKPHSPLPLVLRGDEGVAGLMNFHRVLGAAMIKAGAGTYVKRNFTPHMTLLYDQRLVREQAVEPISWMAQELVLVHSLYGKGVHVPLGRWPLRG